MAEQGRDVPAPHLDDNHLNHHHQLLCHRLYTQGEQLRERIQNLDFCGQVCKGLESTSVLTNG